MWKSTPLAISAFLLALISSSDSLVAQQVIYSQSQHMHLGNPSHYRPGWRDPLHALTARVYAQADLVRSHGDFAVSNAVARQIHADATAREQQNHLGAVNAYWDSKIMREAKRLELDRLSELRKGLYHNHIKARNARKWDWINDLEGGATVENLNFVLGRLSRTLLADDYETPKLFSDEMLDSLQLSSKTFVGLQLKTATQGGVHLRFYADQPTGLNVPRWPYLLRSNTYAEARAEFERHRERAVRQAEKSNQVSLATLEALENAVRDLTRKFHQNNKARTWVKKEMRRWHQFHAAERFLVDLDQQVVRIQNTGDIRVHQGRVRYDVDEHGDHLLGLLRFMADNGIKFDKPAPGEEDAYEDVMRKMRSLFRLVAETDNGLIRVDLTNGI